MVAHGVGYRNVGEELFKDGGGVPYPLKVGGVGLHPHVVRGDVPGEVARGNEDNKLY